MVGHLMILSIMVHMFSVFFIEGLPQATRVRLAERHGALGIASVFGFSGYLLPMDELKLLATKVGLQIPAAIPYVGPAVANMLRGGLDVSEFTVQRFFALHVVVLPAIFLPLLAFHLWLVQRHGNASPPCIEALPPEQRKTMPFFPNSCAKTWPCGSSR